MVSLPRGQVRKMWSAYVVCTNSPIMLTPGCFGHGIGFPAQKARARSRSCSTSLGMIGERFYTGFFDLLEDAHEIAAEDLLDIALRQSASEQTLRDPRQRGRCLEILGQRRNAVEVAADSDVIDSRDFDRMDEVIDDILES